MTFVVRSMRLGPARDAMRWSSERCSRAVAPVASRPGWLSARGDAVFDEEDEAVGFIGVGWDTTEAEARKQADVHLEYEREIAIEVAEFGSWQCSIATERPTLDRRSLECFGLDSDSSASLDKATALALVRPADREDVERAIEEGMRQDGEGRYRVEYRSHGPAGERWVCSTARCFFRLDADGNRVAPERFFGLHQGITEERRSESKIERAQIVAEAVNQAKSEFLANMRLEIRTPMTAILGFGELLARHVSDPDDLQLVETIRRNGSHLLGIINDNFDLAKIDPDVALSCTVDRPQNAPSGKIRARRPRIESGQFTITKEPMAPEVLVEDVASPMGVCAHGDVDRHRPRGDARSGRHEPEILGEGGLAEGGDER